MAMNMMNNVNNCISIDVHPLNLPFAAVNPAEKRPKFLKFAASHGRPITSKPKPARRPDPATPTITRPCTECGKKFWSWKALFGHMRCHPERLWRGINPPSNFRPPPPPPETTSWSHEAEDSSIATEEDHEMAACLLILANGPPNKSPSACTTVDQGLPPEYCDSGKDVIDGLGSSNCRFECSSCKKVFGSHQALGGHRASHKNVKGCYANAKKDGDEDACCGGGEASSGHKCSVCLKVFSSGQALGGHKRCHWEKTEEMASASGLGSSDRGFDLNFPPAALVEDDDGGDDNSSYFSRLMAL